MTEISELQRQLAVLQRVHEEDRRAQQFLEEYKAQGEVGGAFMGFDFFDLRPAPPPPSPHHIVSCDPSPP